MSLIYAWIYNSTGGSVLAAMVFHATSNYAQLFFPLENTTAGLVQSTLTLLLGIYAGFRLARMSGLNNT